VDVYDSAFHPVRLSDGNWSDDHPYFSENSFVDESLPRPYAPFNVQAIGNDIVVTYSALAKASTGIEDLLPRFSSAANGNNLPI
jgi:hypothetical protein